MTNLIDIFIFTVLIVVLNYIFSKFNILIHDTGKLHQKSGTKNKKVPLVGGLILLIFFYINSEYLDYILLTFVTIYFLIGLISDTKYELKPKTRFFFQFIIAIFFVSLLDIILSDVRINFINSLLGNYFFAIFFTSFCIIVLVNGSNFIDGKNTLLIGYYLILCFIILFFNELNLSKTIEITLTNLTYLLIILFIFNFFEKLFMGDSGAYILSVYFSYVLIDYYNSSYTVSPYYIYNLLWYPAFENLFSIIRKLFISSSPFAPDNLHFHQILDTFLKKSSNLKSNTTNFLSAFFINFYNLILILIASLYKGDTRFQVFIIFTNIIFYTFFYIFFYKKITKNN